jgi:hypothetical protein
LEKRVELPRVIHSLASRGKRLGSETEHEPAGWRCQYDDFTVT